MGSNPAMLLLCQHYSPYTCMLCGLCTVCCRCEKTNVGSTMSKAAQERLHTLRRERDRRDVAAVKPQ